MPRLENWSIVNNLDPFQAPELQVKRLEGDIYNDELRNLKDGKRVVTSRLLKLDLINNVAQTNNTEYILGKMSEEYAEWLKNNNIKLKEIYQ
jgi:hypothetical protein